MVTRAEQEAKAAPAVAPITLTAAECKGYESKLTGALKYRRRDDREKRWKDYIAKLGHSWTTDKSKPIVNLISAKVRSQAPKLAFSEPNFEVKPYGRAPNPNSAVANAAILAKFWRQEGIDEVAREVMLDWPLIGFGVGFVGFEKANEGAILDQKRRVFGMSAPQFVTDTIAKVTGRGTPDALTAREELSVRQLLRQRVFVDRVSPLDFVVDPCGKSFADSTFMARRLFLPLDRAQRMFGRFCPEAESVSNVAIYRDSSAEPGEDQEDGELASQLPDSVKRVAVWELFDITTRRTVYLTAKSDIKVIGKKAYDWKSPYPGFPHATLAWDKIPDKPYPEGLMAAGMPCNNELNELRRREMAEAGKAFGKYTGPDTISQETKDALLSGVDGAYVPLSDQDVPITPLQRTSTPPEFWLLEDRIVSNLHEVTLTSAYDSGGTPAITQKATQASYSQAASDAMASVRQQQVEVWAAAVAERMLCIITTLFDEPIPLDIINQDPAYIDPDDPVLPQDPTAIDPMTGLPLPPQPKYVPVGTPIAYAYVGTEHAGYWQVKVTPGSMAANAKAVETQQKMGLFNLFVQIPGFKAVEYAKMLMGGTPGISDPNLYWEEAPPPPPPPPPEPPQEATSQEGMGGGMMPMMGAAQMGSGNPEADLQAGMMGAMSPMTGENGMGGAMNVPLPQA
ncbi:MAG: hypothetical protein WC700_14540 [Gemmatimonadaceae bacterium]|jgi:hypothetical protein